MLLTQAQQGGPNPVETQRRAGTEMARCNDVRDRKPPRQNGAEPVTRDEFNAVVRLLDEHGQIIDKMRRELRDTCLELSENVRRELHTQFTRIAQMQQEIDGLKRNHNR